MSATGKTVVLGLGNPIMSDEGIGVVLVERFLDKAEQYPGIEFIDAGTGGFAVLYHLESARRAIFVDCAQMGQAPGTLRRFRCDEVNSVKQLAHFSLHEGDLLTLIEKAKQLEQCPEEIVIFGIEPETIDFGLELTSVLKNRLDEYMAEVAKELVADA
jgi:hydrogenase maturation protease